MTHESCCEEVRRMEDQVEGLKAEIDQLNVQLAGCSVVALGHSDKKNRMEPGDYGWSASYRDVLALRIAYETVKKKLRKAEVHRDELLLSVRRIRGERDTWRKMYNEAQEELAKSKDAKEGEA